MHVRTLRCGQNSQIQIHIIESFTIWVRMTVAVLNITHFLFLLLSPTVNLVVEKEPLSLTRWCIVVLFGSDRLPSLHEEQGGYLVDAVVGECVDLPPAVHGPAGDVLV